MLNSIASHLNVVFGFMQIFEHAFSEHNTLHFQKMFPWQPSAAAWATCFLFLSEKISWEEFTTASHTSNSAQIKHKICFWNTVTAEKQNTLYNRSRKFRLSSAAAPLGWLQLLVQSVVYSSFPLCARCLQHLCDQIFFLFSCLLSTDNLCVFFVLFFS